MLLGWRLHCKPKIPGIYAITRYKPIIIPGLLMEEQGAASCPPNLHADGWLAKGLLHTWLCCIRGSVSFASLHINLCYFEWLPSYKGSFFFISAGRSELVKKKPTVFCAFLEKLKKKSKIVWKSSSRSSSDSAGNLWSCAISVTFLAYDQIFLILGHCHRKCVRVPGCQNLSLYSIYMFLRQNAGAVQ